MKRSPRKLSHHLKRHFIRYTIFGLTAVVVMGILSIFFFTQAISTGASTALDTFQTSKEQEKKESWNEFYEKGRQAAEEAYHLSNRGTIRITEVQEMAQLEVLSVSAVGYSIQDKKDNGIATSWIKVIGTGTFTVDLRAGEYIIDNERQYVLVRVPKPTLTGFKAGDEEILLFENNSWIPWIFDGDNSKGSDLAIGQTKEAAQDAKNSITQNQHFSQSAETSAKLMIANLVQSLNPDAEHLKVNVEFME